MAHDLVLALLLFWVPAVRAKTLRFGISLDLTSGVCFYCHDALAGLLVWQHAVNEKGFLLPDGSKLRVQLDARDDGGTSLEDNYGALAEVSDFLIGPAYIQGKGYGSMTRDVKAIVVEKNKLAMFWAMRADGAYRMQPLANSTMEAGTVSADSLHALSNLTVLLQHLGKRRLSSLFHNCSERSCQQRIDGHRLSMPSRGCSGGGCQERSLGDSPAAMAWLATAQEQPPPGLAKQELHRWFLDRGAPADLASHFAAELLRPAQVPKRRRRNLQSSGGFIFDISLPQKQWADDLIERVSSETQGAHKFLFVWFIDFYDGSDACLDYRDRVTEKSGTTWAYSYGLNFFADLALNFGVIKYLNPDVLFLCGGEVSLTVLMAAGKGFNVDTNAIAVDRPVGTIVAKALKGVNVNYLLEPLPLPPPEIDRPCDVFGSMQGFVDSFHRTYGVVPGMAALQTAAVGVSLTQAVRKAKSLDLDAVAEWLRSGEVPPHFLGPMAFASDGTVKGINSSTRQFLPLPKDTHTPIQQYNHSLLAIVAPQACAADCRLQFRNHISFPAPDWLNKMAEVYPCALGCEWEGNKCAPCDAGKYRGEQDLQCRPCQDGDYSDAPGAAICLECPPGASCSTKDSKPVASNGHFRVEVAFRVFQYENVCDPGRKQQVTSVRFERCQPPSVCGDSGCVGVNQGMLCGQCGDGYTHTGPGMGGRRCEKCPHEIVVFLGFFFVVLVYVGLVLGLSHLGEKAAYSSGYVPCVLARAVLHYLHLLGAAYEAMRADSADSISGYLLLPIDLLYRPLELIMFDCFKSNTNSDMTVQTLCGVYPLIYPCALGLNLGLHFVFWLLSICRNSTAAAAAHVLEEHKGGVRNGPSWDWCLEEEKAAAYFASQTHSQALGQPSLQSESSAESESDGPKLYSRLYGPGRRFSQLHERFRFGVFRSSFARTSLALTLLLYPVELRGLTLCLACEKVAGEVRLRVDFDVLCESEQHRELVYFGTFFRTFFLFAIPFALMLYLVIFAHRGFKVISVRRSCSVLFDGFKERMAGWEVIIILRTGCVIWAMGMPSLPERFAAMLTVLVCFVVLIFFAEPFLPNYREGVHTFTLLSMLSILVVLLTGRVNSMDATSWYSVEIAKVPILFAAHAINLSVAAFGLLLATFTFALKVDYILQFGASISRWLLWFQSGIQLMRSLHIVEYVPVGDKHFIDVSSLNNLEKWYLARSLTRTVSACIDSGSNFRTWMVEKAIHEAFRRAMQARAAWLRQLYSEFGTTTWFMGGLFRVTLRSPDIHFAEETEESRSNGVTVDELEIALHDVNEDILVHHPTIFCAPAEVEVMPLSPQPETPTETKRANTLHSIGFLGAGGPTGSADTTANYVTNRGSLESNEEEDGGLDILHEFSGETRQYKLETSNNEEREQLEATLRELEEEYETLQDQFDAMEMQQTPSKMSSPTRLRSRMLSSFAD